MIKTETNFENAFNESTARWRLKRFQQMHERIMKFLVTRTQIRIVPFQTLIANDGHLIFGR